MTISLVPFFTYDSRSQKHENKMHAMLSLSATSILIFYFLSLLQMHTPLVL
jgi:hypothetical protein